MSQPPVRTHAEVAAATARLGVPGACCRHLFGAHRPDGSCSLAGVRACDCTGWRPADPAPPDNGWPRMAGDPETLTAARLLAGSAATEEALDAEIGSSGDPLVDAIHDVLARHYPATLDGRWVTCRDELIDAARGWAAAALRITPTETDPR